MDSRMDIVEVRKATDQSAIVMTGTLTTLLLAWIYVALAILRISDADWLLGVGQTLPIISVSIPTDSFFLLVPVLILCLHAATLLQWALFRRCAERFERALGSLPAEQRNQQTEILYPFVL